MKKKGFTLVELLAVIVILAVILLIAVPKIGDIIYSFLNGKFYVYKVINISLFTHEIIVSIESVNNIKNGKVYSIIYKIKPRKIQHLQCCI